MKCEVCGRDMTLRMGQIAHRIPQRKGLLEQYGAAVIHHPFNLANVCSLACNDAVSISNHDLAKRRLLVSIYEDLAQQIRASIHEPEEVAAR